MDVRWIASGECPRSKNDGGKTLCRFQRVASRLGDYICGPKLDASSMGRFNEEFEDMY